MDSVAHALDDFRKAASQLRYTCPTNSLVKEYVSTRIFCDPDHLTPAKDLSRVKSRPQRQFLCFYCATTANTLQSKSRIWYVFMACSAVDGQGRLYAALCCHALEKIFFNLFGFAGLGAFFTFWQDIVIIGKRPPEIIRVGFILASRLLRVSTALTPAKVRKTVNLVHHLPSCRNLHSLDSTCKCFLIVSSFLQFMSCGFIAHKLKLLTDAATAAYHMHTRLQRQEDAAHRRIPTKQRYVRRVWPLDVTRSTGAS